MIIDTDTLRRNYSRLGLNEFAALLGLDARTDYTKQAFRNFHAMLDAMGKFDNDTLAKLGGPKGTVVVVPAEAKQDDTAALFLEQWKGWGWDGADFEASVSRVVAEQPAPVTVGPAADEGDREQLGLVPGTDPDSYQFGADERSVWITVEDVSVYVRRVNDDTARGVKVELYPLGDEESEPLDECQHLTDK